MIRLCYAQADADLASDLGQTLSAAGHTVRMASARIADITDAAMTDETLVVLWSPRSIDSAEGQAQLARAMRAWAEGCLVLATLGDAEPPVGLRDIDRVQVAPEQYDTLLEHLKTISSEPRPGTGPAHAAKAGLSRRRVAAVAVAALVLVSAITYLVLAPSRQVVEVDQPSTGDGRQEQVSEPGSETGPEGADDFASVQEEAPAGGAAGVDKPDLTPDDAAHEGDDGKEMGAPGEPLVRDAFEYDPLWIWFGAGAAVLAFGVLALLGVRRRRSRRDAPAPARGASAAHDEAPADQVFVSYSRKDADQVNRIVEAMEKQGFTVWIDTHPTGGEARYAQRIVSAIKKARAVAVMCSSNAFESDHVIREIYFAGDHRKFFIAAELDGSDIPDELNYFLTGFPRVSAHDPAVFGQQVRALLNA